MNVLLDALKRDYTQRGVKGLREAMNHSRPVRDFFGVRRAVEVTPDLVREYIDERKKSVRFVGGKPIVGLANATINRETEILGRAFRLALNEGTLAMAPKFPSLPEHNARKGFFERHEVEKLLLHLREPLSDMAQFAYATGWRLGEIRGLRWEYVDRRAREIRLPDSKNGEGRVLPLDESLWVLIERRWARREHRTKDGGSLLSEYVFHFRGRPAPESTIRRWWEKARTKVGLPGKLFHDFRRSAVRDMIRGGVPQTIAMSVSGHKTESMFRRYNITTTADKLGVRYAGRVYTSLSGAAMAAAKDLDLKNKTQNGYIFWGLSKPPRPASDPLVALERAWERYRDRVERLVKEGVTEENRGKVAAALGKHAHLIEKLGG